MNSCDDHSKLRIRRVKSWIGIGIRGFCMGIADLIPGISGGTVAFVTGIYEELLVSIKTVNVTALKLLLTLRFKDFFDHVAWKFLSVLAFGIIVAVISFANVFDTLLNNDVYRVLMYSTFFGMIVASIVLCFRHVKKWNILTIVMLLAGTTTAYVATGEKSLDGSSEKHHYDVYLPSHSHYDVELTNYNEQSMMLQGIDSTTLEAMLARGIIGKNTPLYDRTDNTSSYVGDCILARSHSGVDWWIFLCGMIGISAMLLPGISGSYLLNILGAYSVVIGALAELTTSISKGVIHLESFMVILSLGAGVVVGIVVFSRVISWVFERWRNIAIAALVGFMVGALRAVWPFRGFYYVLDPLALSRGPRLIVTEFTMPDTVNAYVIVAVCLFFVATFTVFGLEAFALRKRTTSS